MIPVQDVLLNTGAVLRRQPVLQKIRENMTDLVLNSQNSTENVSSFTVCVQS